MPTQPKLHKFLASFHQLPQRSPNFLSLGVLEAVVDFSPKIQVIAPKVLALNHHLLPVWVCDDASEFGNFVYFSCRILALETLIRDHTTAGSVECLLDTLIALVSDCDHDSIKKIKNFEAYFNRCKYTFFPPPLFLIAVVNLSTTSAQARSGIDQLAISRSGKIYCHLPMLLFAYFKFNSGKLQNFQLFFIVISRLLAIFEAFTFNFVPNLIFFANFTDFFFFLEKKYLN